MDKPISLSMRDYLVRKMAVKLMMSEKTIDAVIAHQFNSANEALSNNYSVELSGFGKFFFNEKKAQKKLARLLIIKERMLNIVANTDTPEKKLQVTKDRLVNILNDIEILKLKLYGKAKTDSGGLEKQSDSPQPSEGTDNQDS